MNRVTISISVLFILLLIIYVPRWLSSEAPLPANQSEEAWRPNYQASNMRSTLYDDDGTLSHQVYASKMEHYQLLGFTLFKQPQYTIYVENQRDPWRMNAAEGTLYEDDRIHLEMDVEIRTRNDEGFIQTIKTNFLEINLTDKTMTSDQAVEIVGQGFVINSNGFTADLMTLEYELSDDVKAIYAPSF